MDGEVSEPALASSCAPSAPRTPRLLDRVRAANRVPSRAWFCVLAALARRAVLAGAAHVKKKFGQNWALAGAGGTHGRAAGLLEPGPGGLLHEHG
jgi:hypothetical protein